MFKSIKIGINYMKQWPLEPLLNPVFKENRVKIAMLRGNLILPPFIVFILFWSIFLGGGFKGVPMLFALGSNFPVVLVCVLFLLLMPLQGYYWFYKRAITPLNLKQTMFYQKLCTRLQIVPKENPLMQDLEYVIVQGLKHLDKEFLKEL